MPQNREQIKHAPVSKEAWRNNRTSVMWFDPRKIRPLGDHILVGKEDADSAVADVVQVGPNGLVAVRVLPGLAAGPLQLVGQPDA